MLKHRIGRFGITSIVIMLALAACQPAATEVPELPATAPTDVPEPDVEEVAEPTEPPEPIELVFWDIVVSEDSRIWWESYVDDFNSSHPNINVTYETFETEPFKAKIVSAVIAGELADIFYQIPGPDTNAWAEEGKILPLDGLLDAEAFVPAAGDGCSYDGNLVCLPLYLAPSFMYYNKAQFADAGVDLQTWANPMQPTWEEFLAAGDALKAAGHVPIALGNADNWPGMFYYWAFQNRYGGVKDLNDAISGVGSYEAPSFIKAGELVQELARREYFPEGYNGIAGASRYALFTQGNGAIIYQGPWMLGRIAELAPEGFEYGTFSFPSFADGDPDSQTDFMAGIDALWISSTTEHPEAAAEFLSGFYEPENAVSYMFDTQNISPVAGVVEEAQAAGEDAPILALAEGISNAAHVFPWWDFALPKPISEDMLSMSQGLFIFEITPEEFAQRLQALQE